MKHNTIIWIFIIIGIILTSGYFYFINKNQNQLISCPLDAKICPDGSAVGRIGAKCEFALCPGEQEGILVSTPKINEQIQSPLKIQGQAKGFWYFEAQFKAELYDSQNNLLGQAILNAQTDWTSENFVPFSGELIFQQPTTPNGILRFLSDNPSGLSQNQKIFELSVQFKPSFSQSQQVLLYYYNQDKDKDTNGNIKCSEDGLVAITKEIPITQTPIQDTIKLLLKGKENLTQQDIQNGITTEFPLPEFTLIQANLSNAENGGILTLKFNDPLNKTNGGACRVKILWAQIEKTAKQFAPVKIVKFLPESLFQP